MSPRLLDERYHDDLIAKSAMILAALGQFQHSNLGLSNVYRDSMVSIESFGDGGLEFRIGYNDTNAPVVEVWKGTVIHHNGDHSVLHHYVDGIFFSIGGAI